MFSTQNLLLLTDSYKPSHSVQMPPGIQRVYSFLEARVGATFSHTVFCGLQPILELLRTGISRRDIREAEDIFRLHFGSGAIFQGAAWEACLEAHGGRLPLLIKAVPEGSVVPVGNVLATIENTDDRFPFVTNYFEGLIEQVWYPSTVATQSRAMKAMILDALIETGDPTLIDFKLHDFGFRGSTSPTSAAIGGFGHLVNFKGTDTVPALVFARDYYHEQMAGFSIPAAEHSTITAWGRSGEMDAYRNMLERFPTGLVAVVSDSYDIFAACRDLWGGALREMVLERDGVLVVRPDSGDPPDVLSKVFRILGDQFGFEVNDKGYRVLHPKVRLIQGDGIDREMLGAILKRLIDEKWSLDNIAFGSGGGLLQKVNRDTQRFAIKCSEVSINGTRREVSKSPVTDRGKNSKAGRFVVECVGGAWTTMNADDAHDERKNQLLPVFENGVVLSAPTLREIRDRAALPMPTAAMA